jgi:hypothetical protein
VGEDADISITSEIFHKKIREVGNERGFSPLVGNGSGTSISE